MKRKKPEDMEDFEKFFARNPSNSQYTKANGYVKVPDKPEIIFPKFPTSTYDPIPGAIITGLQDDSNSSSPTPTGTLKITTTPQGANFSTIDSSGNQTSFGVTTPALTITDMPVGTYNYVLTLAGYNDFNSSINVLANQICCVNVSMQNSTSTQQCVTQPATPTGIPTSVPGYVVIPERTLTIVGVILALAAGLIIGYYILKKK